mgnify:CR=1 FL=1
MSENDQFDDPVSDFEIDHDQMTELIEEHVKEAGGRGAGGRGLGIDLGYRCKRY